MSLNDRARQEPANEELVARARDGDAEAFRILLERHAAALRARVRKQIPPKLRRKLSESDVMQVTSMAAYQGLQDFEEQGEGSFARWLNGIADHKMQALWRRYFATAKRSVNMEVSQGGDRPPAEAAVAPDATPSQHAMASELQERVSRAMAELREDDRTILSLVRQEGLTLAEAGKRMGRSKAAAAKLYGRAVYRLSRAVFKKGEGE